MYKSYEDEIKTYNVKDTHFISYIINTLSNIGMLNIWIPQLRNPKTEEPKNKFMVKQLTRLKDISTQTIFD